MEDVLAVYTRPRDPDYPVACLDESSKQLLAETRVSIPMKPGHSVRCDYEYERNGTANLFMMLAPLEGWRHVKVTDRHTAVDYALVPGRSPPKPSFWSRTISTLTAMPHSTKPFRPHKPSDRSSASNDTIHQSMEVGLIWRKPNWASLSQCLDRRIADKQTLIDEIAAWEHDRNANYTKADWQFTTPTARIKLKHLYLSI